MSLRARVQLLRSDERGFAIILAVALMTLVTIASLTIMTLAQGEDSHSRRDQKIDSAYQAAEAGTNAYLSDLTESNIFWSAYMAKGEATRTDCSNNAHVNDCTTTIDSCPDLAWSSGTTWTYKTRAASDKGWWTLGTTTQNTYQYLIQVYPPNGALSGIAQVITRIDVTGRPSGDTERRGLADDRDDDPPVGALRLPGVPRDEHHLRYGRDDDRPDLRRRGQQRHPWQPDAPGHRAGEPLRRGNGDGQRRNASERRAEVRQEHEPDRALQAEQLRDGSVLELRQHLHDALAGCERRRRHRARDDRQRERRPQRPEPRLHRRRVAARLPVERHRQRPVLQEVRQRDSDDVRRLRRDDRVRYAVTWSTSRCRRTARSTPTRT